MMHILFALTMLACTPASPLGIRFFSVASTSMEPTLHIGWTAATYRCTYGLSRYSYDNLDLPIAGRFPNIAPRRGDVVVFRLVGQPSTFYLKRVIGLPGDRVELRKGRVYLNEVPLAREAIPDIDVSDGSGGVLHAKAFRETMPMGGSYVVVEIQGDDNPYETQAPVLVPAEKVFVLGDNRDNSVDSRPLFGGGGSVGMLPIDRIFGEIVAAGPSLFSAASRR